MTGEKANTFYIPMVSKTKQPEQDLLSQLLGPFAVLLLILMLAIGLQVFASRFDLNPLLEFSEKLPLLGKALTLNSLLDFQWHLLCIIGLLPAGIVWIRDKHVRVDFLFSQLNRRKQATIDLIGHFVFTLPFLIMSIPASWSFMMSAYNSGQGSTGNGLNDLFLVKATLPLGLTILALVVVWDVVRQVKGLRKP